MIVAGLKKMSFQLLRNCLKWSDQSLRRNALRKKMTTASSGTRTWCFGFILHWWTIWLNGQQGYLITVKSRVLSKLSRILLWGPFQSFILFKYFFKFFYSGPISKSCKFKPELGSGEKKNPEASELKAHRVQTARLTSSLRPNMLISNN